MRIAKGTAPTLSGHKSWQTDLAASGDAVRHTARLWSDHHANTVRKTFVKSIPLIVNIKDLLDILLD